MLYKKYLVLIVLSLSALLGACAHNKIYRDELGNCISESLDNCENHVIAHYFPNTSKEFHLGFIEYDDQGQIRDREQMKKVFDTYSTIPGSDDVVVIVFVHGWQHTAEPGDSNVESFKQLLAQVSYNETLASQQDKRAIRRVLGVYIGWRGDSSVMPILKYLTFWSRKATALEVGLMGVTEVILKLVKIVNLNNARDASKSRPRNSRMALLWHSFGGQVVYTALQGVMADKFIESGGFNAQGFGNLCHINEPSF